MAEVERTRASVDEVMMHSGDSEESLPKDCDRTKRAVHIRNTNRLENCSSDNSENSRKIDSDIFSDTLHTKNCSVNRSNFADLFDERAMDENSYATDVTSLKENRNLRKASPQIAGNSASSSRSASTVKHSCNPTFLIVDRVPQLHYEMPRDSSHGGPAKTGPGFLSAKRAMRETHNSRPPPSASEDILACPKNTDIAQILSKSVKDHCKQLCTHLPATATQVCATVNPINNPVVSNMLCNSFNNNQLAAAQPWNIDGGSHLSRQIKKWNTTCSPWFTTNASTKHHGPNPTMATNTMTHAGSHSPTMATNTMTHAGSHSPSWSGRIPRPLGCSSSFGAGSTAGPMQMPIVPGSRSVIGDKGPKVLMMVYGNAEECARVGGCGPRWVYRSEVPEEKPGKGVMDKDGTLEISFDEWRDYLLFHPSANLHDIIHYWRHATSLDIGEDLSIPDDFSHEEWVSGKWWRHLVAGGVAGMVSRTCTAPLDRLKVFLQVHGAHKIQSMRSCVRYMINEGGVKSLWRGNGVNVVKIAPESALKFAAYEQAKSFIMTNFGNPDRELRIMERFLAGSFAGSFSQSVIYPMEVLKTRLALRKSGQYRGMVDAAKQIYRTEGLRSFYRGYVPNLLGIIPYAGIDLAVYETLKHRYALLSPGQNDPSVLVIIGCGALSSSCGQIASYPLALIRTRLQAQVLSKDFVHSPDKPTTPIGIFKHILKTEGPLGLYRGIAPNFMKVAPAVSISYVVYEKCREALGIRMT